MFSVFIFFTFIVCTMSQQKLATAWMEADWTWDRLIAEQPETRATLIAWSALVARPPLAKRIPQEHRATVLLAWLATWTSSKRVNMTSLAKIFYDNLGVTVVYSSFTYHRDAFLFGLMLGGGLEVQSYDLTTEQSVAAFTLAQRLSARFRPLD